ncbi:hypothetical protein CesoFtcFv8_005670 [Champsocephalus esox]|uniref:Uncharacterized protein n=1 Tax=Champsocephalus esox TaxID=159716 RepID=A0AAN8CQB8_9TELE|nr:hypothetical protein CesoFtcFv8_005670 [Champsocephalus esox]
MVTTRLDLDVLTCVPPYRERRVLRGSDDGGLKGQFACFRVGVHDVLLQWEPDAKQRDYFRTYRGKCPLGSELPGGTERTRLPSRSSRFLPVPIAQTTTFKTPKLPHPATRGSAAAVHPFLRWQHVT